MTCAELQNELFALIKDRGVSLRNLGSNEFGFSKPNAMKPDVEIGVDNKKIVLDLDHQDGAPDDWVWMISIERAMSVMGYNIKSLACTVEDDVAFHIQ